MGGERWDQLRLGAPANGGEKPLTTGHVTVTERLWPVSKLKPYPRHAEFGIPELDDDQRADLRADIEKRKLQHPIDIWPDPDGFGIVLGGHERFLAVYDLGWTAIPCRERYDLDTESKRADFVLADNLVRRQLTESQRAAIAIKRVEVLAESGASNTRALMGQVADEAKVTQNAMIRRKAIADAVEESPEFQSVVEATDRGEIDLITASRAAELPAKDRTELARKVNKTKKREKNHLAASEARRRHAANSVSLVDDDEPNSITHPKEAKKNVKALADLEERLMKEDCASQPTTEWIIGIMRRAVARAEGKDLEAITKFFSGCLSSTGPMGRPGG